MVPRIIPIDRPMKIPRERFFKNVPKIIPINQPILIPIAIPGFLGEFLSFTLMNPSLFLACLFFHIDMDLILQLFLRIPFSEAFKYFSKFSNLADFGRVIR